MARNGRLPNRSLSFPARATNVEVILLAKGYRHLWESIDGPAHGPPTLVSVGIARGKSMLQLTTAHGNYQRRSSVANARRRSSRIGPDGLRNKHLRFPVILPGHVPVKVVRIPLPHLLKDLKGFAVASQRAECRASTALYLRDPIGR